MRSNHSALLDHNLNAMDQALSHMCMLDNVGFTTRVHLVVTIRLSMACLHCMILRAIKSRVYCIGTEQSCKSVCALCREPENWIPPGVPRILLSESDFHNPERRDDGKLMS